MMNTGCEMDDHAPGNVYLCQVGDEISCGACCGLYNVARPDPVFLTGMLARRTERFLAIDRTLPALNAFARETEAMELRQRPFPDFHHCPYLGLIGDDRSRVGCLLHPLTSGNHGVDLRGLSYYGGMACRVFFCATAHSMEKRYKRILRAVCDHWYLYGLIVTETALVTACLDRIETCLAAPLEPDAVARHDDVRDAFRELLSLKLDWPFRPADYNTPCHYLFNTSDHPKPAIDYNGIGAAPSGVDTILHQLVSCFTHISQLHQAETRVEQRIAKVVQSIETARNRKKS
jgi:hypothetical protein